MEYISLELAILIPVLSALGVILKDCGSIKSNFIPLILGGVGILLCTLYTVSQGGLGSTEATFNAIFVSITQGILVASVSVYGHQIFKQIKNLKEEETKDESDH